MVSAGDNCNISGKEEVKFASVIEGAERFLSMGVISSKVNLRLSSFISSKFYDNNICVTLSRRAYRVAFQNCSLIAQTSVTVIRRDCSQNEPEIESDTN
jgi:hypothetical protein